jgi:class 3 adenylate cyclase
LFDTEPVVLWVDTWQKLDARLQRERFDLIILEARDPHMLTICQLLKTRPANMLTPIVVVVPNAATRLSAYEAGADEVFLHSTEVLLACTRITAMLQQSVSRRRHLEVRGQESALQSDIVLDTFRRYVSPQLVDRILKSDATPDQLQHGTRTHAAVMFADMRGFTAMAERMAPTQVFGLLNEFFGELTRIAFRHDGTVFSMAGDCLMVGFGVPIEQPDGSRRALIAAREMLATFGQLATLWRERHGVETGLGIGINEGEVVAGNVGSNQYMNYTLIGDTVNVASRLSQRARAGEVLFSGALKLMLDDQSDDMPMMALPPLVLRGRTNPIDIFCVPTDTRVDLRH